MAETQAQPAVRPMDTSEEAWAVAQERIDALRPDQKAQLANLMSIDCERLARAGIALSEPSASDARVRYLLALRRYGSVFADTMVGRGAC
ncbi:MAG: hypothetical protein OES13_08885 [Acidimicrobiia bacterium]|nr:hypothetical protein [Acidimicrobiia bacterium]